MTRRRAKPTPLPRFVPLALCLLIAAAGPASAHEFKLESLMNSFVKIEQHQAHLVIRVPLHVTRTVRLPVKGAQIDLANAGPAIQRLLEALSHDVVLWEDGRPLVPASAIGRLSLPSDRSFERYEGAVAHIAQPPAPDEGIYIDQGYLDAHAASPTASPGSRFGIRTQIAAELKDYLKLAIRYLPLEQEGRP